MMITKYVVKFDEHTSYFSSLKEWDGFLCKWIRQIHQISTQRHKPKTKARDYHKVITFES
jgi:hypothetical protein